MILWTTNYWDGPVSGVCMRNERIYYFYMEVEFDSPSHPRRFGIYWLTRDELEYEVQKHFDFEVSVGTHCCIHLPGDTRRVKDVVDEEFWNRWPIDSDPQYVNTRQPIEVIDEDELIKDGN